MINCETNTKFVRVHDDGFIDIPDVIFYVLYESGNTDVVGCCMGEEYPQIAGEVDDEGCNLLGFLPVITIYDYFYYRKGINDNEVYAVGAVKAFVKEAKKSLPLLRIDTGVDEWMKEH